jgi:hypothetical protein
MSALQKLTTRGCPRPESVGREIISLLLAASLFAPAAAFAAPAAPAASDEAVRTTRGLLIACFVVLLVASAALWRVLVGKDNRFSTSKTTAAIWTYLVASALLAMVIAKFWGHPQGLNKLMHSGLAGQYGLLVGGPLGAAIAAKGIVTNQVSKNPAAKSDNPDNPNPVQLIQNDVGETDLGDLQYVLFNLIAMVYFAGSLIQSPTDGFPHMPDVLLGLTSVSALGYVTKKALPTLAATATLTPVSAAADASVTINGSGLLVGDDPSEAPVIVLFGTRPATIQSKGRSDGVDSVVVSVPQGLPQDKGIDVFVITPTPARVSAGTFRLA